MIADLPLFESDWLSAFFAPPNELTWAMLETDAAPALSRQVRPWLEELARAPETAAVVLPLVRGDAPIGWYAATVDARATDALAAELAVWLGPSYLKLLKRAEAQTKDARVRALRKRFDGSPFLLSGATAADNAKIAERLIEFATLRGLQPTPTIVAELCDLLPEADRATPLFQALCSEIDRRPARAQFAAEAEADAAFDDGEFDRAFELYMAGSIGRKTVNRLLLCGDQTGAVARQRLAARLDEVDPELVAELSAPQQRRLADLRASRTNSEVPAAADTENPWIAWALQLQQGRDLAAAELAIGQAAVTWDITSFNVSEAISARFADLIGNLNGDAATIARQSAAPLIAAFFPPGGAAGPALRPVAAMLFLLLAMEDPLSRADLELLALLVNHRLALGLAAADYSEMVRDLGDLQSRVGSYSTLPWSLDICEALAIAPAAGATEQAARLGFFTSVLGEAQGLTHRLQPHDLVTLDLLAKDFQVQDGALAWLRQLRTDVEVNSPPNLTGKRIGIYTLAEAAGARAKASLEALYPGCRVDVNSDLVCTAQLTSLAEAADLFVFAWKSSSHQAFYCVRDAMAPSEPVWAAGKGTASILRAVADGFS